VLCTDTLTPLVSHIGDILRAYTIQNESDGTWEEPSLTDDEGMVQMILGGCSLTIPHH
jgi:hypothetical protein